MKQRAMGAPALGQLDGAKVDPPPDGKPVVFEGLPGSSCTLRETRAAHLTANSVSTRCSGANHSIAQEGSRVVASDTQRRRGVSRKGVGNDRDPCRGARQELRSIV